MITRLISHYRQSGMEEKLKSIHNFHADECLLSADGRVGMAIEKSSRRLAIIEPDGNTNVIPGRVIESADIIVKERSISGRPFVQSLLRYTGGRMLGGEITGAVFAFLSKKETYNHLEEMYLEICTTDIYVPFVRVFIFKNGAFANESKTIALANRWLQMLNIIKR